MKTDLNHEGAPMAPSAGTAGSEACEGAPENLEYFLRDFIDNGHNIRRLDSHRLPASVFQIVEYVGKEAFAIVDNGHIHIGLVHTDAAMLIGPIFAATAQVEVCYEYGGAWIHTPLLPPSWPLITATTEQTVWEFQDGAPSAISQASLYVLRHGRLEKISTKPARSHYCKDEDC